MRPVFIAVLVVTASCEPRVEKTTAMGTVAGVTFSNPTAISHTPGSGATAFDEDTVLITDAPMPCANVVLAGLFTPDGVNGPDGGRAPSVIVKGSGAFFDVGGSRTRIVADSSHLTVTEKEKNGTLRGHYTATFDAGMVSGDFVAPACAALSSGCSASGAAALPLLALLLAFRRRRSRAER